MDEKNKRQLSWKRMWKSKIGLKRVKFERLVKLKKNVKIKDLFKKSEIWEAIKRKKEKRKVRLKRMEKSKG